MNTGNFSDGLAPVQNGCWGFVDRNNKVIIPFQYSDASSFSDDLAKIKYNNKYGYIDQNGNIIISPLYDEAEDFCDGLTLVSIYYYPNNPDKDLVGVPFVKFKYIDVKGISITPYVDNSLYSFHEGVACYADYQNNYLVGYIKPPTNTKIMLNNHELNFDSFYLQSFNGHVIAPYSQLAKQLGFNITPVNDSDHTIVIYSASTRIEMQLNSRKITVNGVEINYDLPVMDTMDNIYIPVEMLTDTMNVDLQWNSDNQILSINSK